MTLTIDHLDKTELGNALWNSTLYTPKVGCTEGRVLFVGTDQGLDLYACDDFISIRHRVTTEVCPEFSALADVTDVKAAEKYLRENPLDEFRVLEDSIEINSDQVTINTIKYSPHPWQPVIEMIEKDQASYDRSELYCQWALNLDRLSNLRRLKTTEDYPADFRQLCYYGFEDIPLWQFKIGNDIRGVISPMNRQLLKEKGVPLWGH